jgi:hypothetical protein
VKVSKVFTIQTIVVVCYCAVIRLQPEKAVRKIFESVKNQLEKEKEICAFFMVF